MGPPLPSPSMDHEDLLSVGSYITDMPTDSELKRKMLELSGNSCLDISGIKLNDPDTLEEYTSLAVDVMMSNKSNFSFIYCDIGDDNIEQVINLLNIKDQAVLKLGWNKLSYLSIDPIFRNTVSISSLRSIDFDGNDLGPEGCRLLTTVVPEGFTIQQLALRGNAITDAGVEHLCQGILHKKPVVQELNLESNLITHCGLNSIRDTLSDVTNSITSLNLANNNIGVLGAQCISEILGNNCSLYSLGLRGCGLGDVGISLLAAGLVCNSHLKSLDVSDNDIGPLGAVKLFGAMRENTVLATVTLSRLNEKLSAIGVPGGLAVGEMLSVNKSLTSLE